MTAQDFLDNPIPLVRRWAETVLAHKDPSNNPIDQVIDLCWSLEDVISRGDHDEMVRSRQALLVAVTTAAMLDPSEALRTASNRIANMPVAEMSPQFVAELQTLLFPKKGAP